MTALFSPKANGVFRGVLAVLLLGAVGTLGALMGFQRTPYGTGQQHEVTQPVQFDHRHHVKDDLIDCRYCHSSVETAASAGIPSTRLCLNCHAQVWNKSPLLDVVRASWFRNEPIVWTRVHNLPDFVYFNHAIHVKKGVGCVECHGRVDRMPAVQQVAPLTMGWCLDCHRNPAARLRPVEEITNMDWKPEGDPVALGQELLKRYDVKPRVTCYACHR
jgi:hypothetical protein